MASPPTAPGQKGATRSQATSPGPARVWKDVRTGSGGVCAVGICSSCRSPSLVVPEHTPAQALPHQHVWLCYDSCLDKACAIGCPSLHSCNQGSRGGGGCSGDSKDPAIIWGMDRREDGPAAAGPHLGMSWAQAGWVRSILRWKWRRGRVEGGVHACSHFSMTSAAHAPGPRPGDGRSYCD